MVSLLLILSDIIIFLLFVCLGSDHTGRHTHPQPPIRHRHHPRRPIRRRPHPRRPTRPRNCCEYYLILPTVL